MTAWSDNRLGKLMHVVTVPATLGFFRGQLDFMKGRGWEVTVVASPDNNFETMVDELGVPGQAVFMKREISPLHDLRSLFHLWRLFRRERPDIVHGHTPKAGFLSMIAARLAGIPIRIYHLRGLRFSTTRGFRRIILKATERMACTLAHRVITVGPSVMEEAISEGICPRNKITYLASGSSNGVDAEGRFNPKNVSRKAREHIRRQQGIPSDARVVAFIGRLVRDKGIVELAKAWRELRRSRPDVHLLLVGQFEAGDPVPTEIRAQLEHDDRVHFAGFIRHISSIYKAIDLILFPSYREGFPNVPLEAASMQVPVVAAEATGSVDAVVDGVTGALVPVGDHEALVKSALSYLDDADLRELHGSRGRAWVLENYRPEDIWRELHIEYLELRGTRVGV